MIKIEIAKEYTKAPGGRFKSEGEFSGQDFRETLLGPKYKEAKEKGETLIVILDGGYGYATSFLEESFGGLARELKDDGILNIEIISDEEPQLIDKIRKYMSDALSQGDS